MDRRVVIDHVDLIVADLEESLRFYVAALEPLGFELLQRSGDDASFGVEGSDDFGINLGSAPTQRAHVAFLAPSRTAVDAFHQAAIRAGGRSEGGPRLRPEYHDEYYAAFVLDPHGNNIEAVHHGT